MKMRMEILNMDTKGPHFLQVIPPTGEMCEMDITETVKALVAFLEYLEENDVEDLSS